MNIVFIEALEITTIIGTLPEEKIKPQKIVLDLEMAHDFTQAAQTDDLSHALDYATVAKVITDYVAQRQFQLLETLANQLAELLLQQFQLPWLRIRISKLNAVANTKRVGVIIERTKNWQ